jgi:tetratricopeptide (TPR) repeat protein
MVSRLWAVIFIVCCGAAFVDAQIRTLTTVRGQVVAPGRVNAGGIEVQLERAPNRLIGRVVTDGNGNFEFPGLEGGRYEVVVALPGYQEARQSLDVENNAPVMAEPTDGDDAAAQRVVVDTSILNQASAVYIVLVPGASGVAADPDLVAFRRKYSRKVIQDYERAQEDNRKGDLDHAVQRYEALLKAAPDFYRAYNELGLLYQKQNRYREAERQFKAAIELMPQSALPLVNLGTLYLQEADVVADKNPAAVGAILDDALDRLEEAVKLEPHAGPAYYLLGAAYFKSNFLEEAEEHLKHALEIERTSSSARLMLVNVYLRWEKWESAVEHIDIYLTDNPKAANRTHIQEIRSKTIANMEGARQ